MHQERFDFVEQSETPGRLPMADADVRYYPDFLSGNQAQDYFNRLSAQIAWRQEHIRLYGKLHLIPRLQAWYGEPDAAYRYSNLTMQPLRWIAPLAELKQLCEQHSASQFNSVLANLYRDGQDSMGMHADNEPELGSQPVIASVSLGQPRVLIFVHQHTRQRVKLPLASGSLLVMAGATQQYWQHGISKQSQPMAARINLTFRRIITPPQAC